MARRARNPKAFRLSFVRTNAKKWAPTLKQAVADAKYWMSWGNTRVCIDKALPTGGYTRVRCLVKR